MWAENLEKSDVGVQPTQQFAALYWRDRIPECLARAPIEERAWDLRSANPAFNCSSVLPRSNLG